MRMLFVCVGLILTGCFQVKTTIEVDRKDLAKECLWEGRECMKKGLSVDDTTDFVVIAKRWEEYRTCSFKWERKCGTFTEDLNEPIDAGLSDGGN